MKIIRSLTDLDGIPKSLIRSMVDERIAMLSEYGPYVPELGWFVIVEAGDVDIPVGVPCPSLFEDADGIRFDAHGYFSPYEFCIQQDGVFELVRVLSDAGEAVAIFVPDGPEISAELLTMCRTLAEVNHADS